MKSSLPNVNHECRDEDWVPADDVKEEQALLKRIQAAEIDSVQSRLSHCSNDQEKRIDV
jgi:hypothetical protein